MESPSAVDPFEPLERDHEHFVEGLKSLERDLDRLMAVRRAGEADLASLRQAARLFEEELLPHFRREEETVLPPLEAAIGRFGTLVNVIAYEHDEVRREVAKFREALRDLERSPDAAPALDELNRHGIFVIQFLWDHFRKERSSLFETARRELPPAVLEGIRTTLGST